jgi:hypothetical protein
MGQRVLGLNLKSFKILQSTLTLLFFTPNSPSVQKIGMYLSVVNVPVRPRRNHR